MALKKTQNSNPFSLSLLVVWPLIFFSVRVESSKYKSFIVTDQLLSTCPPNPAIDWTTVINSPVQDQDRQSCSRGGWAFSATGAMEAAAKIANPNKELVKLSEDELLDCVSPGRGKVVGCSVVPGTPKAFQWVVDNGGIDTKSGYGDSSLSNNKCRSVDANKVVKISGIQKVDSKNDDALMEALKKQPVSVGVGPSSEFISYKSGIFDGDCSNFTIGPQYMLLVGYGAEDGYDDSYAKTCEEFWLLKNSWGTSWGDKGYIRIKKAGNCVMIDASYPTNTTYIS